MKSHEIRRRLPEIVEFAGLEAVIDAPLRTYSSGMWARLAFSVAAHLDPDILLVDEALAVGDIGFQRKCLAHLREHLAQGRALILVSHTPFHIQSSCGRGLVLDKGEVVFAGDGAPAIAEHLRRQRLPADRSTMATPAVRDDGPMRLEQVEVAPEEGAAALRTSRPMTVTIHYSAVRPLTGVHLSIIIYTGDHSVCVAVATDDTPRRIEAGRGVTRCVIGRLPLTAGSYLLKVTASDREFALAGAGWHDAPIPFEVRNEPEPYVNMQAAMGTLTVVESLWEEPRVAAAHAT
jgi:lipopolysaccharide transport system ATP-binding protein